MGRGDTRRAVAASCEFAVRGRRRAFPSLPRGVRSIHSQTLCAAVKLSVFRLPDQAILAMAFNGPLRLVANH